MDLGPLGRVGVIDFAAGHGPTGAATARLFLDAVRALQPEATLVELGPRDEVLASVHGTSLAPETIGAIGRRHRVDALLVGELESAPADPREVERRLRQSDEVAVEASLRLRIHETHHGLPIWSAQVSGQRPLTRVRVNAWGSKRLEVGHLDEVRLALARELAVEASADFEPRAPAPVAEPPAAPAPAKARAGD
jgi:hypothetical protein